MDLEDECFRCDEKGQKEEIQQKIAHFDEIKIDANGSSVGEITRLLETFEKAIESPPRDSVGSPQTEKGLGLKKWRRIRRDINKDESTDVDANRILKRGLSNAEPEKKPNFSDKNKPTSQASVVANSPSQNLGYSKSVVKSAHPVDKNLKKNEESSDKNKSKNANSSTQKLCSAFLVGMDPDNSDDWSSKSSTAANAPKLWYEAPAVIQFTGEKLVTKNMSGKILGGNAVMQRTQLGKGFTGEKKNRGRVKIEKETYSRSTNSSFSGVSNGKQRERSSNYESQSVKEGESDCYKENGVEVETFSSEDSDAGDSAENKKEGSENHRPLMVLDPYVDSIILLQNAQEALEKEIQNFRTVGKEHISPSDNSIGGPSSSAKFDAINLRPDEPNLPGQFHFEEMESELTKLNQRINLLEHELEDASSLLRTKECKILELESILNSTQLPKQVIECNLQFLQDKYKEMETEFEGLFKDKIEAEIEYLMVTRTIQMQKHEANDQLELLEGQKSLSGCNSESVLKPSDAENMATMLSKQPEELQACCKELLGTEEVIKMQNKACKLTFCLFIQFILLCITIGLYLLKIFPHATGVVPT